MKTILRFSAVFLALLVSLGTGLGQNEAEEKKAREQEKKERWENVLAGLRDENRNRTVRHLAVVISEIERSAGLRPEQKKKLEVGSKGAAERAVEEWVEGLEQHPQLLDQMETMARQQMQRKVGDKNKDEEAEFDPAVYDQLLVQWGRQLQPQQAENFPLWSNLVKKTLTAEQNTKWQASIAERATFARSLQIQQLVVTADQMLRLSKEQREKLIVLLEGPKPEQAEAKKEKKGGLWGRARGQVALAVQGVAGGQVFINGRPAQVNPGVPTLQNLDRGELEKILTKPQLERWDDLKKNPNGMNFQGQFFQGRMIEW